MMKHEKKQREREKKESEAMNRKHLANMRVIQKSLVYVIGLPAKLACDEVRGIRSDSRKRKTNCKALQENESQEHDAKHLYLTCLS